VPSTFDHRSRFTGITRRWQATSAFKRDDFWVAMRQCQQIAMRTGPSPIEAEYRPGQLMRGYFARISRSFATVREARAGLSHAR
jgi:hypothetical protein